MSNYLSALTQASKLHWKILLATSIGFFVLYYVGLLMLTMLRFAEIPNYITFHDVLGTYLLIFEGTPSLIDAFPILMAEPWFETGYKNPNYYGVATWSFMLIPPKMLLVFIMGLLLGIFISLIKYSKKIQCAMNSGKGLYAAAGVGSVFISLTSATLTWVVCCATPSWVVALAMLGMSASLALWLEPIGTFLTLAGFILMAWIIVLQLKRINHSGKALVVNS